MEFDVSKVYTAVNADELKVGSKVIVADSLAWLRRYVEKDRPSETLKRVANDESQYRFIMTDESEYALAYLIEPPEEKKLKWTDLRIEDTIGRKWNEIYKIVYPLGASYRQFDNNTPNELFPDTKWECRWKVMGIPIWVRIK